MGWTPSQLPELTGRTAIVTGANTGLGFEVAKELSGHGARVVLACRDVVAGDRAAGVIGGGAEVVELDLSAIASIRAFAEKWTDPVDLLVNNAGVMAPPKRATTADGFELQFGTNHLGHFVLTGLLLDRLVEASAAARVVTVSSVAHHGGTAAVLDANAAGYRPQQAYRNSKLANLLFALQLHRQLTDRRLSVSSTAAHPGLAATGLFSSRDGMGGSVVVRTLAPPVLHVVGQSSAAGARAVLYAAVEAEPGSYTGPTRLGETRGPVGTARLSDTARDETLARQLWRASEDLTGFRWDWP